MARTAKYFIGKMYKTGKMFESKMYKTGKMMQKARPGSVAPLLSDWNGRV